MAWAPDYTTTDDLEEFMRVTDHEDAAVEARAITASSRAIDLRCGRQFGKVATSEDRYYPPTWDLSSGSWIVVIDDVAAAAGLLVATDPAGDDTWTGAITDFVLRPRNNLVKGRPVTYLSVGRHSSVQPCPGQDVRITTDQFGWAAVPVTIIEATQLQASRLVQRRDSPFGVAGSPQTGSELRLLSKLDPDVDVMLPSYTRNWGAA